MIVNELADLAKENSEHSVEGTALSLLAARSKRENRDTGGEESYFI